MCWSRDSNLMATGPCDGRRQEQEHKWRHRRGGDNEHVRDDRTEHRGNEQQRAENGGRRYEQGDPRGDLNDARHVAEPLAQPDRVEQTDHCWHSGQLGATGHQEHHGECNLRQPKRDKRRTTALYVSSVLCHCTCCDHACRSFYCLKLLCVSKAWCSPTSRLNRTGFV